MHITLTAIAAPELPRGRLRCPVCDHARIAPVALSCTSLAGQRGSARVDDAGVHIDPTAPAAESGSAIVITWRCAAGHAFATRLRSIHGTTTAETTIAPCAGVRDAEQN